MAVNLSISSAMPIPLNVPVAPKALESKRNDGLDLNKSGDKPGDKEVREQFQNIMGEMLFGEMLKSMRKSVGKPAYFDGGRAEEIFTQQLDQKLSQELSKAASEQFVGPMYELTAMARK